MNEQAGFFKRIGKLFKGGNKATAELPDINAEERGDNGSAHTSTATATGHNSGAIFHSVDATRSTFLRPWAKRDNAIGQLQDGFNALTGLMGAVKESLDKQNQRQDELVRVLGQLPETLRSIPETGAAQAEALRAVAEQIKYQNSQQAKLGDILEKVSETEGNQKDILEALRERMENLGDHDQTLADSLNNVGAAMQTVSKHSNTSAQVLEQMRDNINSREGELQRILNKQGNRYTTMLAIAIFLSIAALAAVCVIGYLLIIRPH
jgi:DNA repair exonuclease SbcCD ATPase subunit